METTERYIYSGLHIVMDKKKVMVFSLLIIAVLLIAGCQEGYFGKGAVGSDSGWGQDAVAEYCMLNPTDPDCEAAYGVKGGSGQGGYDNPIVLQGIETTSQRYTDEERAIQSANDFAARSNDYNNQQIPNTMLAGGDDRALAEAVQAAGIGGSEWKSSESDFMESRIVNKKVACTDVLFEEVRNKKTKEMMATTFILSPDKYSKYKEGILDYEGIIMQNSFNGMVKLLPDSYEYLGDTYQDKLFKTSIDDDEYERQISMDSNIRRLYMAYLYSYADEFGIGSVATSSEIIGDYEIVKKKLLESRATLGELQKMEIRDYRAEEELLRKPEGRYRLFLDINVAKSFAKTVSIGKLLNEATGYDFPEECLPSLWKTPEPFY